MNGAGDVVNGPGLVDKLAGFGIVDVDGARIGERGQTRVIFFRASEKLGVGDGRSNHLAPFLGVADAEDLHARTARLEKAKVLVHIFGIRKHVRRAGNVAEDLGGCRDGF